MIDKIIIIYILYIFFIIEIYFYIIIIYSLKIFNKFIKSYKLYNINYTLKEFLKNLYNKQVEIKIWKLIPNNEDKSLSNEYMYKQIRTRKAINSSRKSSYYQSHMKQLVKPLNNLNTNNNQQNKENQNDETFNNEIEVDYSSNQSSLVNYNFSLIPIKPVYDSLQQLNFQFRNSFQIPNHSKYQITNNEQIKNINDNNKYLKGHQQHNNLNGINTNYFGINEIIGQNNINILAGDYINEFTNTVHIRPHPHHFTIPEKVSRSYKSYSRSCSPTRSNDNHSKDKKGKNNLNKSEKIKKKNKNYDDDSDDSNSDDYESYDNNIKNRKKANKNKNKKINDKSNKNVNNGKNNGKINNNMKSLSNAKKYNKSIEKETEKGKSKKKNRNKNEGFSKRKEDDQYELIGKTTLDICKLFFDEIEAEKM